MPTNCHHLHGELITELNCGKMVDFSILTKQLQHRDMATEVDEQDYHLTSRGLLIFWNGSPELLTGRICLWKCKMNILEKTYFLHCNFIEIYPEPNLMLHWAVMEVNILDLIHSNSWAYDWCYFASREVLTSTMELCSKNHKKFQYEFYSFRTFFSVIYWMPNMLNIPVRSQI